MLITENAGRGDGWKIGEGEGVLKTRWWKVDLQVGTPAWSFKMPLGSSYDFKHAEQRGQFADEYMRELVKKKIEVIALAAHNSHEWIDEMVTAGSRHGVVVFPGCEVTTGSGADGVHLLVIGDLSKTGRDFDLMLASVFGFEGYEHERFHLRDGKREPLASSKTVTQILDDLPNDYLIVAPHALGENGIASERTAKGDIRWRALHHPRMSALDPGDCSDVTGESFNAKFRARALDHFPCLRDIAFVSTSDAYSLEELGSRFSWLRMAVPSLEALRQVFLDHEARIICDWDSKLNDYPDHNPNRVQHAWIESLTLGGVLGNSTTGFAIPLHPGLNVLIGGRGSGKSTVVAALRQIYSATSSLPEKIRTELQEFSTKTFKNAKLSAEHHLPVSQELQVAIWSTDSGQMTKAAANEQFPTAFRVRVISQKELFERVAGDSVKRFSASRSLLGLVDDALDLTFTETAPAGSWSRELSEARSAWAEAAMQEQQLATDLAEIPALRNKVKELEGQVAAFASDDAKKKLSTYRDRRKELDDLVHRAQLLLGWATSVKKLVEQRPQLTGSLPSTLSTLEADFARLVVELDQIASQLATTANAAVDRLQGEIVDWGARRDETSWFKAWTASEADFGAYTAELKSRGIEPARVGNLEIELGDVQRRLNGLERKERELTVATERLATQWEALIAVHNLRRNRRASLLAGVQQKSQRLKFESIAFYDAVGWIEKVRSLLGLRADAFLEDVPDLARWIWEQAEEPRNARWALWRKCLVEGRFEPIEEQTTLRATWCNRLATSDQAIRLRLAVEVPDDVVMMKFLKEGGRPETDSDWQTITEGSPGQRTAAMLGLVLHHGDEPLILDQPEDDLDSEWITGFLVKELRASRWKRQIVVASHEANIPVNGDAENVITLENSDGALQVRHSVVDKELDAQAIEHTGPIEIERVRRDIQAIMEGGVVAFMRRERKYNTEIREQTARSES